MLQVLPTLRFALWLPAVSLAGAIVCAEPLGVAPLPDVTSPENALLEDAVDGQLDTMSLLDAALVAEARTDVPMRPTWENKIRHALQQATQNTTSTDHLPACLSPVVRTFHALHSSLLTGKYDAACTPVSCTLSEGNYNCVSATVLFLELCRRQNIAVTALTTNTHVFCQVEVDGQTWDIQTTCPDWFRLSPRERCAVAPSSAATARPIREPELIGKIYYNLGVDSLGKKRFAHAERCFRLALVLDSRDSAAEENLLATWNNWALDLCDRGRYAEAASLLQKGKQLRDDYAPFSTNQLHITQRWAQALCGEGRFREALQLLQTHQHLQPKAPLFLDGPAIVYRLWIDQLVRQGRCEEAIHLLDEAIGNWPACRMLHAERQRLGQLRAPASPPAAQPSK